MIKQGTNMIKPSDQIQDTFRSLKLHYLAAHLDDFIAKATKQRLSPMQMLEKVVELEMEETKRRQVDSRLKSAKLGRFVPMVNFDWGWPKNIPRQTIDQLFTLSFIQEPANVILIGTAGLGKTMIAKNLGYQAAMAGHSVVFVEAADMLTDLGALDSPAAFKRLLAHYVRPQLLIIDEVGYLSHSAKSADILFQVISKRHERSATIITTNKAFKEWGNVFPGAGCVVALIDRLTQCSEIILVEGPSYRLKQAEDRQKDKNHKPISKKKEST
jgi:DNA replication protein DnaC